MEKESTEPLEQDLEFAAQLAAQGRLLGWMYASAFEGRGEEFMRLIGALMDNTARLPVEGTGPGSQEAVIELNARINAHLERFGRLTIAKIRHGRD